MCAFDGSAFKFYEPLQQRHKHTACKYYQGLEQSICPHALPLLSAWQQMVSSGEPGRVSRVWPSHLPGLDWSVVIWDKRREREACYWVTGPFFSLRRSPSKSIYSRLEHRTRLMTFMKPVSLSTRPSASAELIKNNMMGNKSHGCLRDSSGLMWSQFAVQMYNFWMHEKKACFHTVWHNNRIACSCVGLFMSMPGCYFGARKHPDTPAL